MKELVIDTSFSKKFEIGAIVINEHNLGNSNSTELWKIKDGKYGSWVLVTLRKGGIRPTLKQILEGISLEEYSEIVIYNNQSLFDCIRIR